MMTWVHAALWLWTALMVICVSYQLRQASHLARKIHDLEQQIKATNATDASVRPSVNRP